MDNLSDHISSEQQKQVEFEKEVFEYLDTLRESGITNMFGAAPYVAEEFDIGKSEARAILTKWMKSFGN